jgi:hypothetical protein
MTGLDLRGLLMPMPNGMTARHGSTFLILIIMDCDNGVASSSDNDNCDYGYGDVLKDPSKSLSSPSKSV